ncbi:MAG: radical SAM protein [Dehalococcoidia bacterium]
MEEIIKDIEAVKAISEGIREIAWKSGYGDRVKEVATMLATRPQYGQCVYNVSLWLAAGGKSAFLQDSNTLIMRTPDLVQVISFLRKTFPSLERVTTYGRSHTAARKSVAELRALKDAGLDRIHIGLESGYDPLLAYMEKGCTARNHIEAGKKVKEAGISLCEYVMPGLGGKRMSQDHARETAKVLNEIDPHFIRLRTLHVTPSMPLWAKVQDGNFELQTEDEVVRETGIFIESLQVNSYLTSDHILNLLMEVEGKMPEDKEKCLEVINKYLSLSDEERLNFRLGRRAGYYAGLADLNDGYKHHKVEQAIKRLREQGTNIEEMIFKLKDNFL